MFKVNNKDRHRSGIFPVNFEHISNPFLVFLLLTLNRYTFAGLRLLHFLYIAKICKRGMYMPYHWQGQQEKKEPLPLSEFTVSISFHIGMVFLS